MTTFAKHVEAAIEAAGKTKADVSIKLGYNKTFISNVLKRNSVARGSYTKLLRMFPSLREAPLPKNFKDQPSTKSTGDLRERREKLGITIAELARRTKLSARWIGLIEKGEANPSEKVKSKIEKALWSETRTTRTRARRPAKTAVVLNSNEVTFPQLLAAIQHLREDGASREALRILYRGAEQFDAKLEELIESVLA